MKQESWFRPYVTANFWRFLLIVVLGVLTILFAGMLMFTSGYLISKSALRPENILMVYVPTVGVRTFGIGRAVVHYVERLVGHDTILRILSQMRLRLYRILEPQALRLSSRYRTGDLLGALSDDIEYLQDVYIRTVFPSIVALVLYAGIILAVGQFDPAFALLLALYVAVLILVLPLISLLLTKRKNREMKQARNNLYQKLTDAVLGIHEWYVSGRQTEFLAGYEADEAEVDRTDRSLKRWSRLRGWIGQCIVAVTVVSMVYWSGRQYADGSMDVTLIAAFVLVVFPLMDAFLPVSEAVERIPQYGQSVARLKGIESADESDEKQAPLQLLNNEETEAVIRGGVHVKADGIMFSYDRAAAGSFALEPVGAGEAGHTLTEVSLDIPPRAKVAVIGRSGAGKSTLLQLIQGVLAPSSGSLTLGGVEAARFGDEISSVIAVLNQSPHLFDTTLANNIRLGRPEATEEEIRDAAAMARLEPLVASLPGGLDTRMQEAGQRFSGGERQRVALARILLQDTPIVILDEPTVGLDPITERELLSTIFSSLQNRTLIWVTHHLVGVEQMDEIIFMEHGRIAMRGTHDELMRHYPRYQQLYRLDSPEL
ncbi:ABC transporter, CydDC cysteine exporter (CydDC-E) family, permease/ATP-binding protein CydC [Paenibacillus vortex V453]|uniref:ABC transporter, CydDC cysteine exporter (CydDC-E) family, permease/ATP-binding protein CydC n=1 Tax=Paenibacillus vortex V453 TaxID=715225 RepID=A0A2R9T1L7_9BACL|nr:thiol reductant ABC exporter subunit CydC [Paenibacillus vortex]EFU43629.1 ABC transporter, CydDC cysteine exporter (CydDC-E) family, permease/ATP-binding protein CydC [Paenibacillus vortex V453]